MPGGGDTVTIIYPQGCKEVTEDLTPDELIRRLKVCFFLPKFASALLTIFKLVDSCPHVSVNGTGRRCISGVRSTCVAFSRWFLPIAPVSRCPAFNRLLHCWRTPSVRSRCSLHRCWASQRDIPLSNKAAWGTEGSKRPCLQTLFLSSWEFGLCQILQHVFWLGRLSRNFLCFIPTYLQNC